ncbi:hypothetical protein AR457_35505 [Streptomyces agglomeratus]|uniref:hypothetical protein n=1 Tax=Streptomyces agglomeratus TaxID=285458 RepID=UPI000854E810|nr:hypothetical protein [Streptomyces agglomeratus]OEJ22835.1 hypothetical protein AR457_36915 [Streptomyces agglomeratus]OEJ36168.1 hypothetical protein AR457_35505 [Streptomyces agglomeratus]
MGSTTRAMEWLADAALDPVACSRQWRRHQPHVVLLPAGRRWDVVITPEHLGFALLRGISACRLRPGPVLLDACAKLTGFFVPPGTTACWLASGIRCAGAGAWIATPWPRPAPGRLQWLVLPDGTGALNDLTALEHLLHDATTRDLASTDAVKSGRVR